MLASLILSVSLLFGIVAAIPAHTHPALTSVSYQDPLIYYKGRFDTNHSSWWGGSGFKVHLSSPLTNLSLVLGDSTTSPLLGVAVSLDYGSWIYNNFTAGTNAIDLTSLAKNGLFDSHVVRFAVQGWQNNRLQLNSIQFNKESFLLPYFNSPIEFEYIGDSLTAGQYSSQGQVTAWSFLTSEFFKAEHNEVAQPGACLTNINCWGNPQGMSSLYFQTQDSGYEYDPYLHNTSTPWPFSKYSAPKPKYLVMNLGTNDHAFNITNPEFTATYLSFIKKVRLIYPHQPIFIFSDFYQLFHDQELEVVQTTNTAGDREVFFVDTTGWINGSNATEVFQANGHPTDYGHVKIAGLFQAYLLKWGLKQPRTWSTPIAL